MPDNSLPGDELVDTTYAAHDGGDEYLRILEEAKRTGKCPLCPGIVERINRFILDGPQWRLMFCKWPYENAEQHLLIIPRNHIIELDDIKPADWEEVMLLFAHARNQFPIFRYGGGLAIRFGTNSGVTVRHLHFHLIAPVTDIKTLKVYPGKHVNFPIG